MFSRPESSGWKPAPTSRRALTRPATRPRPVVGWVIRARIFSVVLLPDPFGPMIPNASPGRTAKLTPRRAQKSSEPAIRGRREPPPRASPSPATPPAGGGGGGGGGGSDRWSRPDPGPLTLALSPEGERERSRQADCKAFFLT